MRLKNLSKVLQEYPAFTPQWKRTEGDVIAENCKFGSLRHGVVCAEDGSPQYDQPVWFEPLGAVCVPVTKNNKIALLEQLRPVPQVANHQFQWLPSDFSRCGNVSWELPRGFPNAGETPEQTAKRETEEELGWIVESVKYLGKCNANTTFFGNSQAIFLVRVDTSRIASTEADKTEIIQRVRLFSWEEILQMVLDGIIFCGYTKAALISYHAYSSAHQTTIT